MSILSFYLNGALVLVDFSKADSPSPFCSVLHYVRQYCHLTGTKEGCGKGDCGACTVIVATPTSTPGVCTYKALDSCLLRLPDLHGKHLLTIEAPEDCLCTAPIREAFLRERASQCGFCSPGMVLSAYAHIKNNLPFTREEVQRTLSGNLCRCTGYQAILDAVQSLDAAKEAVQGVEKPLTFPPLENPTACLTFQKDSMVYVKPFTASDCLEVLAHYQSLPATDVHVAAGMTGSAMGVFQQASTRTQVVIDVSCVAEFRRIEQTPQTVILGASCTVEEMRHTFRPLYPSLSAYLDAFASAQIRNKATLGGSLADGSPVGDAMPFCMALNATCLVLGPRGMREVPADRFTLGYRKVDLQQGEVLAAVRFPLPSLENPFVFVHKQVRRRNMDISCVSFACLVSPNFVRLVYGGMAAVPAHAVHAEAFLKGKSFSVSNAKKAAGLLAKDFTPLSDIRGSSEYRMKVAQHLLIFASEIYNKKTL